MTSLIYAPADSRGWGIGNATMRDYFIGGALQPSDIYTVRVREHWRRPRKKASTVAAVAAPAVVVTPASRRGRPKKRAPAPVRVLRSTRRNTPVAVPVAVPAVGPPTTLAVPAPPQKRRRIA